MAFRIKYMCDRCGADIPMMQCMVKLDIHHTWADENNFRLPDEYIEEKYLCAECFEKLDLE